MKFALACITVMSLPVMGFVGLILGEQSVLYPVAKFMFSLV